MSEPAPLVALIDASRCLFTTLLRAAEEREDVRAALTRWNAELGECLARMPRGAGAPPGNHRPLLEKVLTPGGERRVVSLPHLSHDGFDLGAHGRRERRPPDLAMVARRARWKADACRWAVERRRLEANGGGPDDARAREEELRARRDDFEDCFPWMLDSYRRLPDDERLSQIAACYDNVALAAECAGRLCDEGAMEPAPPAEILYHVAEVQSALLAALEAVDLRGDSDQRDLFAWLKSQTLRHRIYVDRHMKLDDPADFTQAEDLARRLREVTENALERRRAYRRRMHLLGKLRYHLGKREDGHPLPAAELDSIEAAVAEWIDSGFPPADRALGEMLESLAAALPEGAEPPPRTAAALDALRQRGARSSESSEAHEARRRATLSPRASELVQGMHAAIFGGPADAEGRELLQRELAFASLAWVELGDEPAPEDLEREIARPNLDLVMIAVRLPVPAYAEFKRLCQERNVPFVRLPGGYAPGQVAQQILRQVGRMLQGRAKV